MVYNMYRLDEICWRNSTLKIMKNKNPVDQNLEFNKKLRGSAENWLVWQIMHRIYVSESRAISEEKLIEFKHSDYRNKSGKNIKIKRLNLIAKLLFYIMTIRPFSYHLHLEDTCYFLG